MDRRLSALAAACLLAVGGCGDDDPSPDGGGFDQAAGERTEAETPPDLTDTNVRPAVEKPTGTPPRKLVIEEIVRGRGPGARPGDTVVVHYVGVSFSNGEEFDASWDTGQPYPVQLGAGRVIPGWEKGLVGIREGGRRRLVIPPELAYGAAGAPPDIGANETLVFVIDALAIQ
ncbi:MAG TPA: FKBP-type peptidyl-prolyl cis-trans isomerase [Thermoleophilaceae bacterium]|nr:FKBP-type peptidyl-prolyl cis-trans isomerase [Thermoleophilaceae bacterium]